MKFDSIFVGLLYVLPLFYLMCFFYLIFHIASGNIVSMQIVIVLFFIIVAVMSFLYVIDNRLCEAQRRFLGNSLCCIIIVGVTMVLIVAFIKSTSIEDFFTTKDGYIALCLTIFNFVLAFSSIKRPNNVDKELDKIKSEIQDINFNIKKGLEKLNTNDQP